MQSGPRLGGVFLLTSNSFWVCQVPEAKAPLFSAPGRVVLDGYGDEYHSSYGDEYYSYDSILKIGNFENQMK